MKILSLAQIDLSQTDARVVHLLDLAKGFRENGVETDVVVISSKPSVTKEKNLKVCVLPSLFTFWAIEGIVSNILAWFIILLKGRHYDKIYLRHHSNLALALKFALTKTPIWLEVNGIFSDEEYFRSKFWASKLKLWLGTFLERLAFRKANHLFCVTLQLKEKIIELYSINPKKVTATSNGVDIEIYRPLDKKASRRQLGLEENAIYIGFIGSFVGWSGIDTLLNVLPNIMQEYNNLRAIIVGNGEFFTEYTNLANKLGIRDKVIFPGQVHKNMAPIWINAFDIGISLTKPKGHGVSPIKLYSYMACGIPVLVTDLLGFEPVKEFNVGFSVPYKDSAILKTNLQKLVADEKLRQELGQNGRRCAKQLFSWQTIAQKIIYPDKNVVPSNATN